MGPPAPLLGASAPLAECPLWTGRPRRAAAAAAPPPHRRLAFHPRPPPLPRPPQPRRPHPPWRPSLLVRLVAAAAVTAAVHCRCRHAPSAQAFTLPRWRQHGRRGGRRGWTLPGRPSLTWQLVYDRATENEPCHKAVVTRHCRSCRSPLRGAPASYRGGLPRRPGRRFRVQHGSSPPTFPPAPPAAAVSSRSSSRRHRRAGGPPPLPGGARPRGGWLPSALLPAAFAAANGCPDCRTHSLAWRFGAVTADVARHLGG